MAKTIVSIDDSMSLRQVVGIVRTGAGYEVLEACDGQDAWASAARPSSAPGRPRARTLPTPSN